ncbi:hypothetical protein WJX84_009793 [Apatococcus fuscideae]|uniref:Uncharacterized protein n=1 Tax=Apatococcus fuscideae TaxID=2026836 RepID=A0AAW1SWR2_9CHLO
MAADATGDVEDSTLAVHVPPVIDMVQNPHKSFPETCIHCDEHSPLGEQCCGMCVFENTCTEEQTDALLSRLASMNIDLSSVTPATLFDTMKGRSVWLVGDSQMKYFYTSLECFLADYAMTPQRSLPFPDNDALNVMMRRGTDYNIFWDNSKCMFLQEGTRICHIRKVFGPHILEDVFPALIAGVPNFIDDIMVVNIGTWYDPGNPGEYQQDVQGLADWMRTLRAQLPRKLIWADTPPQHFQWDLGYAWKSGVHGIHEGNCVFVDNEEHRQGSWNNLISRPMMQAIPIAILNSYNITTNLWEWHLVHIVQQLQGTLDDACISLDAS